MNFKPTKLKFLTSFLIGVCFSLFFLVCILIDELPISDFDFLFFYMSFFILSFLSLSVFGILYVVWSFFDKKENSVIMWKFFFYFIILTFLFCVSIFFARNFGMENISGCGSNQFCDTNEQIKDELIQDLKTSSESLSFRGKDFKFKTGDKREMYFSVRNNFNEKGELSIFVGCYNSSNGADYRTILLKTFTSLMINVNEVKVGKIQVTVPLNQKEDTYLCALEVYEDEERTKLYARKEFNITVE